MALPPGAYGLAVTGKEINTARETCKAGLRDFAQFVDLCGARPGGTAGPREAETAKRFRAHVAPKIPLTGLGDRFFLSRRTSSGSSAVRSPASLAEGTTNRTEESTWI